VIRRLVAGLIVVGLAVGVWALWPRDDSDPTATTLPLAVDSTTSTSTPTPHTTTSIPTVSSTTSHVVTTVEEAEAILRELWFGWFEGIYNQDEARIREVVGTQALLNNARNAFGSVTYEPAPTRDTTNVSDIEILRSDEGCLVAYATLDISQFAGPDSVESSVYVMRRVSDQWKLTTIWINREDLWNPDCESQLESLS
jgi:hypothetical protein